MADYVIRSGDTLSQIAQRVLGSANRWREIAAMNGIAPGQETRIQPGQVLIMPGADGAQPAARPAGAPAPTTGAMPLPRPQQVAAMDPLAAPVPQPNPSRPPPPLPPQNPARPGVPGPPLDRGAPLVAGGGPAGYAPAGWTPVPAAGPVPTTQQWAANRPPTGSIVPGGTDPAYDEVYGGGAAQPARQQPPPAPPGNGVGMPVTPVQRGGALPDVPPDFMQMNLRQLGDYMSAWVGGGRRLDDMPPEFQEVWQFRQQEARDRIAQDQAALDRDHAAYRNQWGTDMRYANPPPPPAPASIGEGEYLPVEMVQLGQLGANMNNAPSGNPLLGSLTTGGGMPPPGAPVIGGTYLPQAQQPTLGQLAKRPWPGPSPRPYLGV